MSNQTIDEVSEILEYIKENNTVPRNIREAASDSKDLLNDETQDHHARTLIWEVLSKLESI